ncbi:hypothetical protein AHAS_Ahas15G0318300 [Arachis hypogaea]
MVGLVGNYKGVYHSYCLGTHQRVVLVHSASEDVVAKRVDQILVTPPIFGCPILDASLHCNLHFLQHNCNCTHS